jgi:DMSO/TMAO reductase YedYZ molybdopterin-dependent catalytic subunit
MGSDEAKRRGFLAGVIAGVPMVAAMFLVNGLLGLPTLPDLFADPLLFLLPGAVFGALIDALHFTAKTLLLAGLLLGQLFVCGLVGRTWAGRLRGGDELKSALVVVGVVFVLFEVVLLPLLGEGFATGLLGYGAVHLVYAVSLVAAYRWLQERPANPGRRQLLATFGAAGLAVVGGGTLWRAAGGSTVVGASSGAATGELSEEVTPLDRFYTVSKNLADPRVDAATWQLRIDGHVERPTTLTYEALKALPSQQQYFTLACISNLVGGDLIGNTRWRGVRLRDLIEAAGPRAGVRKVVFHAADGYTDSIAFDKAMEDATLLAYEMDGQPLTAAHGLPARLLIPDIYGMKNVKWVTKVELLTRDYRGYWQERGWNDLAEIQTLSRIDVPLGGRTVEGETTIGGVAHAGSRGVKRVEVSVDGGRSWVDAQLRRPLSQNSWTIWTYEWTPPGAGQYRLVVRATDGFDRVQLERETPSFPDGATGWHSITVRVL